MSSWFDNNTGASNWKREYYNPADAFVGLNQYLMHGMDREFILQTMDDYRSYREIFFKCSPLAAILYKRAEAFASGELSVLNRNTQNDVRGVNKEWQKLVDNPNWMQTKTEFLQQLHLNTDLFGWCVVLKVYPAGFTDRPKEMWVLPTDHIEVEPLYNKPYYAFSKGEQMRKMWFVANGERRELKPEEIIIFRDTKTPLNPKTWLPEARMVSSQYPISKLISAEEAGITLIQRKGALGILSNEGKDAMGHITMDNDEKKQVQQEWSRYGMTRGQWQVIITDANLKWQSMAFNVKELMLHETYLQAVKDLCDEYNYPFPLTAHSDQSTYNNVNTADRQLIQNIMPEAKVIYEQYDAGLDAVENNIQLWCDYSKHPALQATEKEKADALIAQNTGYKVLWEAGLITKNMWLEKIGENKVADPEFDKYRSETQEYIDQQNALNNGGNNQS